MLGWHGRNIQISGDTVLYLINGILNNLTIFCGSKKDMPFFVFAIEAREYPPFFPSILTPSFERETKKEFRWEGLISDSFMRPNAGKICFANTQY